MSYLDSTLNVIGLLQQKPTAHALAVIRALGVSNQSLAPDYKVTFGSNLDVDEMIMIQTTTAEFLSTEKGKRKIVREIDDIKELMRQLNIGSENFSIIHRHVKQVRADKPGIAEVNVYNDDFVELADFLIAMSCLEPRNHTSNGKQFTLETKGDGTKIEHCYDYPIANFIHRVGIMFPGVEARKMEYHATPGPKVLDFSEVPLPTLKLFLEFSALCKDKLQQHERSK